jgi:hypothetical protein
MAQDLGACGVALKRRQLQASVPWERYLAPDRWVEVAWSPTLVF